MCTLNRCTGVFSRLAVICLVVMSVVRTSSAEPVRIMPLGDSITAGRDGGYRTLLFNLLNINGHTIDFVGSSRLYKDWPWLPDHDHEGHGGWRVDNIQRNIVDWLATYQPDVILLHIGTNDISNGEGAIGVSLDLSYLLETIFSEAPDVTVHVASIILRTDNAQKAAITDAYAAMTPYVVGHWAGLGYDARFVDMHAAIGPDDLADGIHPTDRGYDKMALVWFRAYDGEPADMRLSMPLVLRPDDPVTLTATSATPNAEVQFFGSIGPLGSTWIPDLNVSIDLTSPVPLDRAVANAQGAASINGVISPDLAHRILRVQAADLNGRISQALVRIVRD